jgi:hypothetical protein
MSDPTRLREAGSDAAPELRELFRSAQKPEPLPAATEARVLGQVTALGATSAAPLAKLSPWLLAGGLVVLAAGLALLTPRDRAAASGPRLAPAPTVTAPVTVHQAPLEAAAAKPPPEAKQHSPVPSSARATPAEPASAAAEDALAGEAKLLNQAHAAMATDPQTALSIAGEHAKRYPRGQLAAERELILVQALVKLGRTREAEARGRALRKSAPGSIYGERLDTILKGK